MITGALLEGRCVPTRGVGTCFSDQLTKKIRECAFPLLYMETTLENETPVTLDASMEAFYEGAVAHFVEGSIVTGKIIRVHDGDVLVDIGYKSEGTIPLQEFKDLDEDPIGQEVEVFLEHLEDEDGVIVISKRRAERQRAWDHVVRNCEEGSVVEGTIKSVVKGGFIVDVGADAFLPGSQLDVAPVRNPEEHVGKAYTFRILKINLDRNNIVISRRNLIEEERREERRKVLADIQVGQRRTGTVKNITDFGAFVDLDGIDGLLHVTDMTWGRINHPSDLLKVGDELSVIALDIDIEKERISLGLKQTMEDPWKNIESRYPTGARVRGKVVNLMPYGAFIEIEEGVEGLVHVSQMSWTKRIQRAAEVLDVGDEVNAMVLAIDTEEKRISLGMRQTEENPWEVVADKYSIGSFVVGKVRNFAPYGAFVEIESGVDGMIHISDMSWVRKVNHPSEMLSKGEEVRTVVLEIDSANQRISLGLKQVKEDPWASAVERYPIGAKVRGMVKRTSSFGAFIEIEENIIGLLHISQISDEHIENVRDVLNIGDEIEARVVKVDATARRIGLSVKAAKIGDDKFDVQKDMLEGLQSDEELVNLSGEFDTAFGDQLEEWHPGRKAHEDDKAAE